MDLSIDDLMNWFWSVIIILGIASYMAGASLTHEFVLRNDNNFTIHLILMIGGSFVIVMGVIGLLVNLLKMI